MRDEDDWQDVRPRRWKALRQEALGQDRQRESKWQRQGDYHGYGNQQDRLRVRSGYVKATSDRDDDWEYVDDRSPVRQPQRRSWSGNSRWQEEDMRAVVPHHG